jgi:ribose transport system permease protein
MPSPSERWNAPLLLRTGASGALAAVIVGFALAAPGFLRFGNLADVVQQSAILGVLALGMTLVMIAGGGDVVRGGIDLSLAANLGLSAAVFARLIQAGGDGTVAIAAGLGVGLLVGVVNAVAVVWLRIVPLLATLAVAKIVTGLECVLTRNSVVTATSPQQDWLSGTGPFGIPVMAYGLAAVAGLIGLAVRATPLGPRLLAVGAHPEAARAGGLSVPAFVAASYVASGLLGGLAAILSAALVSGSSPGSGNYLLPVVVAALLGVTFSRRQIPTIGGTVLAVLFIGLLGNGFQLINLSSDWVNGIEGLLILLLVGWTSLARTEHGTA